MLTLKNFKEVELENALPHRYYSMKKDGFELTLEPCMSGFDVALYRKGKLVQPKLCTAVEHHTRNKFETEIEIMQRALDYANDVWSSRNG